MYYGDFTNVIVLDLDGTLCVNDSNADYIDRLIDFDVHAATLAAKKNGYHVIINTSRNVRTYKGDIDSIQTKALPIINKWLNNNKVLIDDVVVGKVWCGPAGYYVDDRMLSVDEFVFKFCGAFSKYSLDVVVPCYNEQENIINVYKSLIRLDRLYNIKKFIFVNNGSTDNTAQLLNNLEYKDSRINIVTISENIGYGYGLKMGIASATADLIMTCHADLQFDPYAFTVQNKENFTHVNENTITLGRRVNRPLRAAFTSSAVRMFLSFLSGRKICDFNGHPKIFFRTRIISELNLLPDDFSIDFAIVNRFNNFETFPVIEMKRNFGVSSWAGVISGCKIFYSLVRECLKKQ